MFNKIHIICGNCGNSSDFSYKIEKDEIEKNNLVFICCLDCGTLHDLRDNDIEEGE